MLSNDPTIWLQDRVHHDLVITDGNVTVSGKNYSVNNQTVLITNDMIDSEKFELSQSLNSDFQLKFGSCESASIKFSLHENLPTIKDKTLKVYIIPDHDAGQMIQLGVFKVYSDTLSGDSIARQIVAYDSMCDILNADVTNWYNTFFAGSGAKTISTMRASFLNHFGITAEATTLVNDSMAVTKTLSVDTLSGADVIRAICEINGCFGTITHEGKFRFFELSPGADDGLFPSDTLYPANDLYPQDVNPNTTSISKNYYFKPHFEDYNAESITKLVIFNGSIGSVPIGSEGNTYTISDNFLLYDKTSSQLTSIGNNIISKITNRYYKPCSFKCIGNPCHELGDPVRINTVYRGVVTYILERKLTGVQALKDEYTARGTRYYEQNINSIASQFQRVSGTVAKLEVSTDRIDTEVSDLASQTSTRISQLSDRINLKVSQGEIMSGLARETAYSAIEIMPNKIAVSSSGTFTVDSSNFKLTSSGYCEMGNCMIKGGTISLGTSGSTQLWIDLDRGFQMSDGSNLAYLQEGYLSITAYHAYGDRILRFDNNGLTLSDNAVVTVSELNVPNGGVGASKTQRSIYWRKASSLGNDEYVLCGEHV